MLDELKFVMGAVSRKDLVPGMQHFCIENGTIRSYNGSLGLCAPIAFEIDCKPHAKQLIQVIGKCNAEHTVVIKMDAKGDLVITNGPYTATVQCITEDTPHVKPAGDIVYYDGAALRKAFKALIPFVGDDASRTWTNGILLSGQSAFATNNVIVCQSWLGVEVPRVVNVPGATVKEVLRVGLEPTHAQVDDNSITFHFENGKWIRSGLWDTKWPEVERIFARDSNPVALPEGFFEGLDAISAFTDKIGTIYFQDGALRTHLDDGVGASYSLEDFPHLGSYSLEMLKLLEGVAQEVDWSHYPDGPAIFHGDYIRGAIMGRHHPRLSKLAPPENVPGYASS